MGSGCMDHYEKQLYSVFKTFDVNNEEALDRSAVLDLCDALQLEDRGTALVDTLFEGSTERVTFSQFRNGLLTVLGGGSTSSHAAYYPTHSDEDSSGREVAPKFVFGSKKYGRRSRPPSTSPTPRSPEVAISNETDATNKRRLKNKKTAMEIGNENPFIFDSKEAIDHERLINLEESLILCRNLNMNMIDQEIIETIFKESASNKITIGEFFNHLNSALTVSISSQCTSTDTTSQNVGDICRGSDTSISSEVVVDAWESAGIEHARQLLLELGFTSPTFRAPDLLKALDDELHALEFSVSTTDGRYLLLQATLTLQQLLLSQIRQYSDSVTAENAKLKTDLSDANLRAQTLAQEVDENHARIELSLKGKIKQIELKHSEESKMAASEWAIERERFLSQLEKLEKKLAKSAAEETKFQSEINSLQKQNEDLTKCVNISEEKICELKNEKETLAMALKTIEENSLCENICMTSLPEAELLGQLEELKLENKLLRDRNDELCAELESTAKCATIGNNGVTGASWREEVAGGKYSLKYDQSQSLTSLYSAQNCHDELDSSFVSIDQKVFGQFEVIKKLQGVLETIPKVSLSDNNGCETCNTLRAIISNIQEKVHEFSNSVIYPDQSGIKLDTSCEASVQTDSNDEVAKLKNEMLASEAKHVDEKLKLSNLVKELESNLEQIKLEYDKCEEYWSSKLDEEREIYAEEQKISDERLTELISKISEYEQQFAPKSNSKLLPTIEEKYSLEEQFNDLEHEFDNYKKETQAELQLKSKKIEQLKEKIASMQDTLPKADNSPSNGVKSPIEYLWSQGTIHSPTKEKYSVRDYQNPAFLQKNKEKEKAISSIEHPVRSSSAGAVRVETPNMIHCSELEGQLRQQRQEEQRAQCACPVLEVRCRQLVMALRQRQMCLDAVQQAARSEGEQLRARVTAAESAVASLQSRLTAADLLVKELYIENCQLFHQTRLL